MTIRHRVRAWFVAKSHDKERPEQRSGCGSGPRGKGLSWLGRRPETSKWSSTTGKAGGYCILLWREDENSI